MNLLKGGKRARWKHIIGAYLAAGVLVLAWEISISESDYSAPDDWRAVPIYGLAAIGLISVWPIALASDLFLRDEARIDFEQSRFDMNFEKYTDCLRNRVEIVPLTPAENEDHDFKVRRSIKMLGGGGLAGDLARMRAHAQRGDEIWKYQADRGIHGEAGYCHVRKHEVIDWSSGLRYYY